MRKPSSIITRGLVGIAATALAFTAIGAAAAQASSAGTTIDTYSAWDGSATVTPFGCPETSVYGQTFTFPEGSKKFTKITWPWVGYTPGSMVVHAYVYAWNGTMASGKALAKTKAKTISYDDAVFHNVTFKFKKAKALKAGSQYVVFASIDQNYGDCTGYTVDWGLVTTGDPYTGGGFVYLNSDGDMSQWTTVPWGGFGSEDVAFKATLK